MGDVEKSVGNPNLVVSCVKSVCDACAQCAHRSATVGGVESGTTTSNASFVCVDRRAAHRYTPPSLKPPTTPTALLAPHQPQPSASAARFKTIAFHHASRSLLQRSSTEAPTSTHQQQHQQLVHPTLTSGDSPQPPLGNEGATQKPKIPRHKKTRGDTSRSCTRPIATTNAPPQTTTSNPTTTTTT